MQGKLSIEQKLADCVVGEQKTITLVVTPTKNESDAFEADVDEVVDYEEEKPKDKKEPDPKMGKHMAPAARKAVSNSY